MKSAWIAALGVLCAMPALGQSAGLDTYPEIRSMVMGTGDELSDYLADYPKELLEGLDGTWVAVSHLFPEGPVDAAVLADACGTPAAAIAVARIGDHAFTFTFGAKDGPGSVTNFVSRGGNSFIQSVDPDAFLARLGLDGPGSDSMDMVRMQALNNATGLATLMRPSPDLLVLQTNYTRPVIFGRCPG